MDVHITIKFDQTNCKTCLFTWLVLTEVNLDYFRKIVQQNDPVFLVVLNLSVNKYIHIIECNMILVFR